MFYELIHFKISPILLLTLGLSSEFLGTFLIAVDAVAIKEFLLKFRSDVFYEKRRADLAITKFINRSIAFIVFGTVFAIVTTAIGLDLVLALLLAPLGFIIHRLISRILGRFYSLVRVHPPKLRGGCILKPLSIFIWLLWFIGLLLTFTIYIGFDIGFVVVVYGLSEKYLKPLVIKFFDYFSEKCIKKGESWFLKSYIITGILLILFGFLYQITGTILIALY